MFCVATMSFWRKKHLIFSTIQLFSRRTKISQVIARPFDDQFNILSRVVYDKIPIGFEKEVETNERLNKSICSFIKINAIQLCRSICNFAKLNVFMGRKQKPRMRNNSIRNNNMKLNPSSNERNSN